MKFFSRTLIFILIGWMAVASWWYVCKIKGLCFDKAEKVIYLNDLKIDLEGENEMLFSVQTSKNGDINFQNKVEGESVGFAAGYLIDHPEKNIAINGNSKSVIDALITSFKISGIDETRISHSISHNRKSPTTITTFENPEFTSSTEEDSSSVDALANQVHDNQVHIDEPNETPTTNTVVEEAVKETAAVVKTETKPKEWLPCPSINTTSSYPTIDYILFASKSWNVRCTSTLKKYAEAAEIYLRQNGGKIVITGHTDADKKTYNNISLGLKRASEVKKYLMKSGIPSDKIETYSKGDAEPIGDNNTLAGKKLNRRVTIELN